MTRRVLAITLAIIVILPVAALCQNARADLYKLFDDEWEFRLDEFPLFATMVGDNRGNDRLDSVSLSDELRRGRMNEQFLDRLRKIDRDALDATDQVNYDIFERTLRDRIAEFNFGTYMAPITNRSGFHTEFPELPDDVPLETVEDFENYNARLAGFLAYSEQHIECMRAGIKRGWVLPGVVLEGWEGAVDPHIVDDPEESLLYKPYRENAHDIDAGEWTRLAQAARQAIRNSVVPGYRAFRKFMAEEYVPAARPSIGASALPDGRAFYEHRVRRFTTTDVDPKTVHETGLREVARIRSEMQEIIDGVGFTGSFAEFVEFLRTDDRFYVDTPEELMKEVAFVLKKMDGELPKLFKTLPRMPYGIKRVPDYIAPKTTTAYYNRPAGDGTRAGFYYVNCYDLRSRPLYEVEALSLHEAVPGHHLQIALMQELEDVPMFRRFGGFTAFVEGWALYSERLGLESGFYQDPYSNFGRLTYEMWRALRLVVDTGMHYFDWSRQKAIDYMEENSALTLHNITTEVDRYISWPGQALAYKTGELKIRALRRQSREMLGERFDVREFHDVVLGSGAVPLDVLEANVNAWIERTAAQ